MKLFLVASFLLTNIPSFSYNWSGYYQQGNYFSISATITPYNTGDYGHNLTSFVALGGFSSCPVMDQLGIWNSGYGTYHAWWEQWNPRYGNKQSATEVPLSIHSGQSLFVEVIYLNGLTVFLFVRGKDRIIVRRYGTICHNTASFVVEEKDHQYNHHLHFLFQGLRINDNKVGAADLNPILMERTVGGPIVALPTAIRNNSFVVHSW